MIFQRGTTYTFDYGIIALLSGVEQMFESNPSTHVEYIAATTAGCSLSQLEEN